MKAVTLLNIVETTFHNSWKLYALTRGNTFSSQLAAPFGHVAFTVVSRPAWYPFGFVG